MSEKYYLRLCLTDLTKLVNQSSALYQLQTFDTLPQSGHLRHLTRVKGDMRCDDYIIQTNLAQDENNSSLKVLDPICLDNTETNWQLKIKF